MTSPSLRVLSGRDVLCLDDPTLRLMVEEGTVGVFSVSRRDGVPFGSRHHLFDVEAGNVLVGQELDADATTMLVGVPIGTAAVLEREDLERTEAQSFADALQDSLGLERVKLEEHGYLDGLALIQEQVVATLVRRTEEIRAAALARAKESIARNLDATTTAVRRLRSVVDDHPVNDIPEGEDLYCAMFAVGLAAGVKVKEVPPTLAQQQDDDPIQTIARSSNLRIRRVMLPDGWHNRDGGPMLGFERDTERPLALIPRGPSRYAVYEPNQDTWQTVDDDIADTIDMVAYSIYRAFPGDTVTTGELLRFALAGRGRDFAVLIACALAGAILSMLTPVITAQIVDVAIPYSSQSLIWQLGLLLFGASIGRTMYSVTASLVSVRIETKADTDTQAAVWDRLLRSKLEFFRRYSVGDLEQRVRAVGQIRAMLSGATLRSLLAAVMALLNLVLLFVYIPGLAPVAIAAALLTGALTAGTAFVFVRYQRRIHELAGSLSSTMLELVQGVTKLRLAAAEGRGFLQWANGYAEQQRLVNQVGAIGDVMGLVSSAISSVSLLLLFWFASDLIARGDDAVTSGTFLAFYVAFEMFRSGVADLSGLISDLLEIKVLKERAQPILEARPEVDEHKTHPGRLEGRLALERVRFRYREGGGLILENVSLKADVGEKIALVGPSGSGKSTIMRLLLGFETPESGAVRIDGQDVAGLSMPEVRRQIGVVLQSGAIVAGSLADNVASGRLLSLQQVEDALRLAGMADDLAQMPMGVHTVVSEGGSNLSGGQRQRLLIARAIASKPRLLLFDEATSALDNKTQAIVTQSLEALHVTQVIIAHRLSTIRKADRIYVLEKGRIVEEGSFKELLERDGLFAQLMRRQQE